MRIPIKYTLIGGIRADLINKYNEIIHDMYKSIKNLYPDNVIILSGLGALFYYVLEFDLKELIEKIPAPYSLEFLILDKSPNPVFHIMFMGDYKKIETVPSSSSTFINEYTTNLIKSFEVKFSKDAQYNILKKIPIIDIHQLKNQYTDKAMLNLIDEIIKEL